MTSKPIARLGPSHIKASPMREMGPHQGNSEKIATSGTKIQHFYRIARSIVPSARISDRLRPVISADPPIASSHPERCSLGPIGQIFDSCPPLRALLTHQRTRCSRFCSILLSKTHLTLQCSGMCRISSGPKEDSRERLDQPFA